MSAKTFLCLFLLLFAITTHHTSRAFNEPLPIPTLSDHLRVYFGRAAGVNVKLAGVEFELEITFNIRGQLSDVDINSAKLRALAERHIFLQKGEEALHPYWELVLNKANSPSSLLLSVTAEITPQNKKWDVVEGKIIIYLPTATIYERSTYSFVFAATGDKIKDTFPRAHFSGTLPDLFSVPMKENGLSISLIKLIFFLTSKNKRREYARNQIQLRAEKMLSGTPYEQYFPPSRIETITNEIVAQVSRQTNDFDTSLGHIVSTTILHSLRFSDELLPVIIADLKHKGSKGDLDAIAQTARESTLPFRQCLQQAIQLESDAEAVKCVDKWSAQAPVKISEQVLRAKLTAMSMDQQAHYALTHYRACLNEHYFSYFVNHDHRIDADRYEEFKKRWAIFPTVSACLYSTTLSTMAQLQEDIAMGRPHILQSLLNDLAPEHSLTAQEMSRIFTRGLTCLRSHRFSSGKAAEQTPFRQLLGLPPQNFTEPITTCFEPMEQKLKDSLPHLSEQMDARLSALYQRYQKPIHDSLEELTTWATLYHAMFVRP